MKAKKYVFKWYKKRDRRKADWLSIGANGVLRLGRALREKLPERIQIGFDPDQRTLAVMEGREEGFPWPRSGTFTLEGLPAELIGLGLKLPLSFRLRYDSAEECWLGKPYPRRIVQMDTQRERQYDIEQLMAIYPDIIPDAVARIAKTTPLAERRAIATEAFCRAAHSYRPCYGELEKYLTAQVQAFLSQERQDLLLMLESGYSLEQIEECLHMDKPDIYRLGAELGNKWREFSKMKYKIWRVVNNI